MEILILCILILLNGIFSLSEIALVSAKTMKLEKLVNDGKKNAKIAIKLRENSENFLSAIQVGITLIGIVTGVYGGTSLAKDFAPIVAKITILAPFANEIAMAIIVILITYVSIVIGELVPKTIGLSKPEKFACIVAPFIWGVSTVFFPIVKILSGSTNLINKLFGIKQHVEQVTEEELRLLLKAASSEGVIEQDQESIHENLFYFSDKKAKHLMTHRIDIEWIDLNDDIAINTEKIKNFSHNRIICCDGDLDNVLGYISTKSFLLAIENNAAQDLKELVSKATIVTENSDAKKVFTMLKKEHQYFCIVIDEYGGFEGIITLYDIMENILGEIPSEGSDYEPEIYVREDKSVLVSGEAPIERLSDVIDGFSIDLENADYSTVAGYIIQQMNKIPEIGDKMEINGFTIEVVDIDEHRIDKILISKNKQK